jgi:TIR domain
LPVTKLKYSPLKWSLTACGRQNAAVANSIVENLEKQGVRCWLAPRDVQPGTVYADAIVRAINEAKALVLVLSRRLRQERFLGTWI